MNNQSLQGALGAAAIAAALAVTLTAAPCAAAAEDHPVLKRKFDLPPSAELIYAVKARQKGFSIDGEAVYSWRTGEGKYLLTSETRAGMFGKILENRSEGLVDSYGIAPLKFYEKRIRKDPWTTVFNRDSKTITFADGKLSYPLKGGEQDRSTAPWQLAAVARAAPDKFTPGSEWTFFTAGRRDAEPWTFKVIKKETIHTGLGDIEAVHLEKAPPPDSKDQAVDLWLSPSHEWYPVRIRFTDSDDDYVEQTIQKINKR